MKSTSARPRRNIDLADAASREEVTQEIWSLFEKHLTSAQRRKCEATGEVPERLFRRICSGLSPRANAGLIHYALVTEVESVVNEQKPIAELLPHVPAALADLILPWQCSTP